MFSLCVCARARRGRSDAGHWRVGVVVRLTFLDQVDTVYAYEYVTRARNHEIDICRWIATPFDDARDRIDAYDRRSVRRVVGRNLVSDRE